MKHRHIRSPFAVNIDVGCGLPVPPPWRLGEYDALTVGGVYQVVKEAVARAGITKRVHPHCSGTPGLAKDEAYEAMIRALTTGKR